MYTSIKMMLSPHVRINKAAARNVDSQSPLLTWGESTCREKQPFPYHTTKDVIAKCVAMALTFAHGLLQQISTLQAANIGCPNVWKVLLKNFANIGAYYHKSSTYKPFTAQLCSICILLL